jgi:hypothetical protein
MSDTAWASPQQAHEMCSLIRGSRWFNSNVAHHCPVLPRDTSRPFCWRFRQANGMVCYRVLSCDKVSIVGAG